MKLGTRSAHPTESPHHATGLSHHSWELQCARRRSGTGQGVHMIHLSAPATPPHLRHKRSIRERQSSSCVFCFSINIFDLRGQPKLPYPDKAEGSEGTLKIPQPSCSSLGHLVIIHLHMVCMLNGRLRVALDKVLHLCMFCSHTSP